MISAVLDTNVLASGTLTAVTPPGQILDAWRDGQFKLVISVHIIDELKRTLQKPYFQNYLTPNKVNAFLDLLENEAIIIPMTTKVQGVATHPEDDLILAVAINTQADYFVTGDGPLLRKVGGLYKGIKLITPNDFLEELKKQI